MLKIDPINLLSLVIALAAYVGAIRLAVIGRAVPAYLLVGHVPWHRARMPRS